MRAIYSHVVHILIDTNIYNYKIKINAEKNEHTYNVL